MEGQPPRCKVPIDNRPASRVTTCNTPGVMTNEGPRCAEHLPEGIEPELRILAILRPGKNWQLDITFDSDGRMTACLNGPHGEMVPCREDPKTMADLAEWLDRDAGAIPRVHPLTGERQYSR